MNNSYGGISTSFALFLIFLVLKLCKIIDWGWVWIFSPIWIQIIFYFVLYLILCIYLKIKGRR